MGKSYTDASYEKHKLQLKKFTLAGSAPSGLSGSPGHLSPAALEAAIPVLKNALDANMVRDHAGRVPFRAPRQPNRCWVSPRRSQPHTDSSRDSRSRSMPATSTLRGEPVRAAEEDRGAVLALLQQQVADLCAQLRTPSTVDPHPGGRAAARAPEPSFATSPCHYHPSGVPLGVGFRPASVAPPIVFPASTESSRAHQGLGPKVCRSPSAPTTLFPVSPVRSSSSGWPPASSNHRFVLSESVHPCPSVQPRQSHVPPRLLTPPAYLATLDIEKAYTHIPMRPNLRRYLAFSYLGQLYFFHALPFGLNRAGSPCYVVSPRHGVSPQLGEVSSIPHDLDGLAQSQVVPSNGPLATSQRGSVKLPFPGAGPASRSLGHPSADGMPRRCDQFCVSSAPLPPPVVTAAHRGWVASLCGRQGRTGSSSPGLPCSSSILGISGTWALCSSVSCPLSATLSLDECIRPRLGGPPRTVSHGRGPVVSFGTTTSCQRSRTTGCSTGGVVLRPPPSGSSDLYRQQDGSVHAGRVSHPLPHSLTRAEVPAVGTTEALPPCSGVTCAYGPQRGGRCSHSSRPAEQGMDAAADGVRGCSPLGGAVGGGPDGVSGQPPPLQVGVSLPSPRGSGGGLSKFRLECLRVLVSLPSDRHDPPASPSNPRLSGHSRGDYSVAATRVIVSLSVSEGAGTPSPPHDVVPAHGGRDCLALVRHLCTLDRPAFLRHVLSSRYPSRIIDTLLAVFRLPSQRQHDLAWRSFQCWLPAQVVSISRVQVLEFLQHMFDEVGLSPRTVLCYRAAIKWPLHEAFGIDFGHDDFRRQATELFHLRPPSTAPLPQ